MKQRENVVGIRKLSNFASSRNCSSDPDCMLPAPCTIDNKKNLPLSTIRRVFSVINHVQGAVQLGLEQGKILPSPWFEIPILKF